MSQSTIQIDLELAAGATRALRQAHTELSAEIAGLSSTVDALLPTWDGDAKGQFAAAWAEWLPGMRQVLAAVAGLAAGIQREADEIRDADASSSFHTS